MLMSVPTPIIGSKGAEPEGWAPAVMRSDRERHLCDAGTVTRVTLFAEPCDAACSSHPAGNIGDARQACPPIVLGLGVHGGVRAYGTFLDLEAEHAAIFQLELAAQERLRVKNVAVGRPSRHKQLHFAAAHLDVHGLVALSVVVE